jgi:hypothetical protein
MVYDRSYTNASTSTDKAKTETSNNHTLSMLPSVVAWTVKSLAVLQSGVTTLAPKYVPSEWKNQHHVAVFAKHRLRKHCKCSNNI